jgi:hypothetical protein
MSTHVARSTQPQHVQRAPVVLVVRVDPATPATTRGAFGGFHKVASPDSSRHRHVSDSLRRQTGIRQRQPIRLDRVTPPIPAPPRATARLGISRLKRLATPSALEPRRRARRVTTPALALRRAIPAPRVARKTLAAGPALQPINHVPQCIAPAIHRQSAERSQTPCESHARALALSSLPPPVCVGAGRPELGGLKGSGHI